MIINYSVKQTIASLHHARMIGVRTVLLWRTIVDYDDTVLLVIPFSSNLHYGIFDATQIRIIDL